MRTKTSEEKVLSVGFKKPVSVCYVPSISCQVPALAGCMNLPQNSLLGIKLLIKRPARNRNIHW